MIMTEDHLIAPCLVMPKHAANQLFHECPTKYEGK
jgi:hypothetical protein